MYPTCCSWPSRTSPHLFGIFFSHGRSHHPVYPAKLGNKNLETQQRFGTKKVPSLFSRVILFLNIGSLNIHRINPKFNVDSKLADENMFHVYQGKITCDQNKFWVNMVEITTATTYILRIFDKVLLLLPNQSLRSFRNKQIEEFKRKHRGNSSKYPRKPTYPTFGKGKSTYKSPFNM